MLDKRKYAVVDSWANQKVFFVTQQAVFTLALQLMEYKEQKADIYYLKTYTKNQGIPQQKYKDLLQVSLCEFIANAVVLKVVL